jgi:hypothetical protein
VLIASPGVAYASVFAFEAGLFAASALLAWKISAPRPQAAAHADPETAVRLQFQTARQA